MVTLFPLHLFSHILFVFLPKINQAFHQYELTVMWLQLMLLLIDLQLLTNYYAAKCGWDCHNAQNKLPKLNIIVHSTEMISSELEPNNSTFSFCVRTISNLHSNVSINLSLHQPYWRLHVTALSLDFAHIPIQLYQWISYDGSECVCIYCWYPVKLSWTFKSPSIQELLAICCSRL